MLVSRKGFVRYYGTDPNTNNQDAYIHLLVAARIYMRRELGFKHLRKAPRDAKVFPRRFEQWIDTATAKRLKGRTDLVMTSPPYFNAEVYESSSRKQSANRYPTYADWREGFYRRLFTGAYELLKPGGVFVCNVADVTKNDKTFPLEKDADELAKEAGFIPEALYKLALSNTNVGQTPKHHVIVDGVMWKYEPVFCFRKPKEA
jgi:hypothetical protein